MGKTFKKKTVKNVDQQLVEFLKRNKALGKFLYNCNERLTRHGISNYDARLTESYIYNSISSAFVWDWSTEGCKYWAALDYIFTYEQEIKLNHDRTRKHQTIL